MDEWQAKNIIKNTFENSFDKDNFIIFLKNFLKTFEEKKFVHRGNLIPDAFEKYISSLERIGKYTCDDKEIDLLIVQLKRETSLERARTMQRNFIAWYLNGSRGGKQKDAALVAFVSPDSEDWRFSLVKMDYRFEVVSSSTAIPACNSNTDIPVCASASGRNTGIPAGDPAGRRNTDISVCEKIKTKVKEESTPARRWSFLVGRNESSHTAQSRFIPLLMDDAHNPNLADLEEAFNIETVTKEFFLKYRELFIRTKEALDEVVARDAKVKADFDAKGIDTVNFAKKLLGQIVFLYFLQKKGWFGVDRDADWGTGPKDFLRRLFNRKYGQYNNFFNDILEPLFYEALRVDRSHDDHYYSRFNCKIPFLNGGLFDPIGNYDWVHTDITLPNELFSNNIKTKEGDIGNGILDIFDRYNFTVKEDEPMEKEVAIDPELLGKVYEKFNAITHDNFEEYKKALNSGNSNEENKFNKKFGVYYTPREIVHYMCKQSLINYLYTCTEQAGLTESIKKQDIEYLIEVGEMVAEHEATALRKQKNIESGNQKSTEYISRLAASIRHNASTIDKWLADIRVCDPAVGSGAFPVGMMHEIVKTRNLLSIHVTQTGVAQTFLSVNVDVTQAFLPVDNKTQTGISEQSDAQTQTQTEMSELHSKTQTRMSELQNIHITHRNLPHWTKQGAIYWVTFRLADSLPKEKLEIFKNDREIWLSEHPQPWNSEDWNEYNQRFDKRFHDWLDAGHGDCILGRPEIREKVKECLLKYDGQSLKIHSAVIMPNHVHLLIEPLGKNLLPDLLKGIKGASARAINQLLGKTGNKVWMEESYDHIVRSEKEYHHFIKYISENPIKANLPEDKYWLYVAQTFLSVNVTQAGVAQAFLPVDVDVTQAFLPVDNKTQTGISEQSDTQTQTGMSELQYGFKRHCIEHSLYGVDIDPGAVEIAKLRLWLSLVVDEDDIKNIKPLPNLDYKIVCGNSLLDVENDLFNDHLFAELEKLKPLHFNETNPSIKQELKKKIDNLIFQITNGHSEFDFEVYFSEVFHQKDGFDIVIGNPPYIQLQKAIDRKNKVADLYKNQNYKTFERTGDIYCLFYEKGLSILKNNGILTFITSNKWMRAGYGEKLREFFSNQNPMVLVDLGPNVFESATVDTNILIIQKAANKNNLLATTINENKKDNLDISQYVQKNSVTLTRLTKDAWFIGSDAEQRLKEKIERMGKPLKDWDVKIYRGVLTGLNEAFIISTEKRNEILANCRDEDERRRTEAIIKPILRGRDIKRYYYEWAGLWVIGTFPALRLNIEDYPAIKKYFLDHFDIRQLEQSGKKYPELGFDARKKTGNKWFETQDQIAYYPEFEKEKVVWQRITQEPTFCLVDKNTFVLDSMAFFVSDRNLKYQMAVLNSKVIYFYVNKIVHQYGFTGFRLSNQYVEIMPIPPITPANEPIVRQIEELVKFWW